MKSVFHILNILLQSPRFLLEGYQKMLSYGKPGNLRHILFLGIFYAVELLNYQLPNIALKNLPGITSYIRDVWYMYLHAGMLLGAVFFCIYIWYFPKKVNKLLNWSIAIHAVGATITAFAYQLMADNDSLFNISAIHLVGLGRAIFGIGFSAGLGLAMTLIVENFSRSFRTWAATVIGMCGFSGPVLANITDALISEKFWLLIAGATASFVILFLPFPKDSELRKTDGRQQHFKDIVYVLTHGETLKLLGACSLMGVSIQFFSDMVSWLPRICSAWTHDWAYALRYSGFIIGTLGAGVLSKFLHQRRKVIFGFIFAQLFVVVVVMWLQWWYKRHVSVAGDGHEVVTGVVYFFLGAVCGNWIITILQTAEQFSVKERPVMTIVVPNFYRLGTVVIVLLNLYYWDGREYHTWLQNFPIILFAFWIVFIGASLAASILLKDNFEGDAYEAEYAKENAFNIASRGIRSKFLREIGDEVWTARDERPFLTAINNILYQHFRTRLKGYYILSTIFYAEDERRLLEFAGFGEKGDQFDRETCKRYEIGPKNEKYSPINHHNIVHDLIRSKVSSSLALWMTDHPSFAGILIYYSGWREKLEREDLNHYHTFDLSNIPIDPGDIKRYIPIIRDSSSKSEKMILLEEMFRKYGDTFNESFLSFIYEKDEKRRDEEWENGLKKTLLLHRLDASDYGTSNYYSYYINPYFGNEQQFKIALILKTAIQLRKDSLGQIRDLLSSIILLRSGKIYKYNSEQFFRDEDHSTRAMLQKVKMDLEHFQKWFNRTQKIQGKGMPVNWEKLDEIRHSLKDSEDLVNTMYNLKVLNMALIRYHGGAGREELEKKGLPQPENVFLCNMINHIVERKGNRSITNSVPPDIKVKVIATALYIILDELIQNAIFYADDTKPYIHIRWISRPEEGNYYELHIQNNVKTLLTEDQKEALKGLINDKIYDTSGRLGIPTIHRILRFRLLNSSEKPWNIKCQIQANIVDLYLLIPKEDIYI